MNVSISAIRLISYSSIKRWVKRYVGKKMLVLEDGYLKPSELGMCFLNDILVDFMD